MNDYSTKFAQSLFHRYYETTPVFGIREIEKRELAFSSFGKQGMVRHTSFPDMQALADYIRENVPLHFYYSSAYYDDPTASMDNKKWRGADLVFDIDGDHIEGADKMSYAEMLSVVKGELKKLLALLVDDLSISKQNLEIVFSGSRGYHVHVYTIFNGLESQERREIVDYITGRCVQSNFISSTRTKWEEKMNSIKASLVKIIDSSDRKWRQKLEQETGESTGEMGKKDIKKSRYLDNNVKRLAVKHFSSRIDEPVTIDIHRLMRTPGSLHGKSALLVKTLEYEKLDVFDPLAETIPEVFLDRAEVNLLRKIDLEFMNEKKEIQEGRQTLPTYAALYAVLKGSAEFVDT